LRQLGRKKERTVKEGGRKKEIKGDRKAFYKANEGENGRMCVCADGAARLKKGPCQKASSRSHAM